MTNELSEKTWKTIVHPEDVHGLEKRADEIKKHIPDFTLGYTEFDPRQNIANSWPKSIDDSSAQADWGWKPEFDLSKMTADMLKNLKK
jgi:nucleoside-diphosphate-sugar epimerase